MTNPISLKCHFPDSHQELSTDFNLYAIIPIPMESTAEISEYFNAIPVT
ncbi:17836_t:CDS:2 [Entrophospora sp. SA101]|nr:17836_t:CDS:2 [Entrophospora sp. SA101]